MANLKQSRVNLTTLHEDIVANIDGVLSGAIAFDDASAWAVHMLYEQDPEIPARYLLETTALRGLMMSKAGREGSFDDLRKLRAALSGEGKYVIEMQAFTEGQVNGRIEAKHARNSKPGQ